MNSKANAQKQNIAVNIWFRHDAKHIPEDCDLPEEEASLNNYFFPGMHYVCELCKNFRNLKYTRFHQKLQGFKEVFEQKSVLDPSKIRPPSG